MLSEISELQNCIYIFILTKAQKNWKEGRGIVRFFSCFFIPFFISQLFCKGQAIL